MTYALDTASSNGQSNESAAGKPLPVLRTLKKNVRSAHSKTASSGARQLVETREQVLRKDDLEEMFVASRKRFLAIAYSILRNRADAVPHDDGWTENIPDSQPDPEMIHAERETLQFIDEKLGELKPVLREAFTMTYYGDLSGAEACAVQGVSSGTFKARIFRARRQLLARTERALVIPIRRTPASSSKSWKHKRLRTSQGFDS